MLTQMKHGCCLLLLSLFVAGRLAEADVPAPVLKPPVVTNASARTVPVQPEAVRNFQVKRGFRLEVVAAEPVVAGPVAMAFDENARMFVLEWPDGAGSGGLTQGRVRLLEDSENRGIFDTSSVYADNLTNPTAIVCYGGGVFVAAAGQILYLKDTKRDGLADARREVFKSFGDANNGANGQVIITSLAWGPDNRIHAATMSRGGDVISSSAPKQSVILGEGGFSFDPRTFLLAAESGSGASGMCFDDRGRKFISTPANPAKLIMYDARYEALNPYYKLPEAAWPLGPGAATLIYSLVPSGSAAMAPVHFSAAKGITIYRGNAFPRDYVGDVFSTDAAANIVHHMKLTQNGVEVKSARPADELTAEFLAGRDNSFQPMQVANAPDGTLYVAGLSGSQARAKGRGCIFRVVPVNFQQPKLPPLSKMPAEQLVSMLRHPNGWHRDTASRLLFERQDTMTIAPLIRLLFDMQAPALARMHALRALGGIEFVAAGHPTRALLEAHLWKGLSDPDERVREQAVLLAEGFVSPSGTWSDRVWGQLANMGTDPSPQVRWQLALTLGMGRNQGRAKVLADIVRTEPASITAALASLKEDAAEMFTFVVTDPKVSSDANGKSGLWDLVHIIGEKGQPGDIRQAVNTLQNIADAKLAFELARTLQGGVAQADGVLATLAGASLRPLIERAQAVAVNLNASEEARSDALKFLRVNGPVDQTLAANLAREWTYLKPWLQTQATATILARPELTAVWISALESGLISRSSLTLTQIRFLLVYPDMGMRQRAGVLFSGWSSLERQAVVNRYRGSLQMAASVERGHKVFSDNCDACHQTADEPEVISFAFGLGEAAKLGKEKMLVRILDPNRAGTQNYPVTIIQTRSGESLVGFVASQTGKSLKLLDTEG
ncbi:MAG: Cytochrome c, partial [Pedosphaera sp.]|nr:Cytochrome c [Pedosphaera sp.]